MSKADKIYCRTAAVCSAIGTVLLILIILMFVPLTVPKLLGYQPYTVVSGSMEPAIATVILVYVRDVGPEAVVAKDVIAYYGGRDRDSVITHRVVENNVLKHEFITKGDANAANDVTPVLYHSLIGKVELAVPKLGFAAQFLGERNGKCAIICVIGLAVVLHIISMLLSKRQNID